MTERNSVASKDLVPYGRLYEETNSYRRGPARVPTSIISALVRGAPAGPNSQRWLAARRRPRVRSSPRACRTVGHRRAPQWLRPFQPLRSPGRERPKNHMGPGAISAPGPTGAIERRNRSLVADVRARRFDTAGSRGTAQRLEAPGWHSRRAKWRRVLSRVELHLGIVRMRTFDDLPRNTSRSSDGAPRPAGCQPPPATDGSAPSRLPRSDSADRSAITRCHARVRTRHRVR